MNLPEFSVNRKVTISMLAGIVVLFGMVAYFQLGLDLMPELDYPVVAVVTRYHGVASEDIENLITRRVEEICSTVQRVKKISSTSQEGVSSVLVELEWGTNLDFTAQDIREKLKMIEMFMPADADDPMVVKFDPSQMPVLVYGITGIDDTMLLRKYLEDNITPRLERIEGVAAAMTLGGLKREINIYIDKSRLEAYKLSMDDVTRMLMFSNMNVSAGHVTSGHKEYMIRTLGEFQDIETIKNTVLTSYRGTPVHISDISRVVDTHKEKRYETRLNSESSVILMVAKQSGANTVKVINQVKKELKELGKEIPGSIKFCEVMDQAHIIKQVASGTVMNAIVGGVLAIGLIFLFLRNWRPTFAVFLAIPLSIITSFIGMWLFGYTLNIITLAGLALVVGMLVDNAVVVIENTFRHLEEGKTRKEAAKIGASEVGMAITTATLTTVAVFIPMVLGGGLAGKLSTPLAVTVSIGLFASLFVALTIVPMVASVLFKQKTKKEEHEKDYGETVFERVKEKYKKWLFWTLTHRNAVAIGTIVAFIVTLIFISFLGFEFMPKGDMPMMLMSAKMPVGTSLEETDRVIKVIEDSFMNIPEKKFILASIGPSEMGGGMGASQGLGATDVNEAMVIARLVDKEDRKKSSTVIMDEIRMQIPKLNNATFEFMDLSGMMTGGMGSGGAPVAIKLFGKDLDTMKAFAKEISERIKDVDGLRDINISMKEGKPELHVLVDRKKAAQLGLAVGQIANTVRVATLGTVATRYRKAGEETDVRVRFQETDRNTIENIKNITIASPLKTQVLLDQVADITYEEGPIQIARENRMRKITITANTTGKAIDKIVNDIKKRLSGFKLPYGYFVEYGGSYQMMRETLITFLQAFIVAVILIYMIMAAQFESFSQPLVIMFTVPLAVIGVVFGLAIFGFTLSTPAFMGIIILAGVVVNNGIVMINYVNQLRKKGLEKHEALIEGASVRLRPILITTLTTVLGVLPMALDRGQGAEMKAPIAVAVGSGLLFATLLTLFVVPAFYSIVDHISYKILTNAKRSLHGEEKINNTIS